MSDLCLVASMLAKMHMVAQNNSSPVPPRSSLNSSNPRAVVPVVAVLPQPTLTPQLPALEFSPPCDRAVQRVYQNEGRTLPVSLRPRSSPQPSRDRPDFTPLRNSPSPSDLTPQSSPRFSLSYQGPRTGSQLYHQRLAALQHGRLYTRLPSDSFRDSWSKAKAQPSYDQWKNLLAMEAHAVSGGQGKNQLSIMVGDSISLWLPRKRSPLVNCGSIKGFRGIPPQGFYAACLT